MSTRANIIIKDEYDKLWFYRHSDGYPSGALPTLQIFMDWLTSGQIRDNVGQAAGWLIVLGAIEYGAIPKYKAGESKYSGGNYGDLSSIQKFEGDGLSNWKVGAYEPTTGLHGDIEYLYLINLKDHTLKCFDDWDKRGNGTNEVDLTKVTNTK